MLGFIFLFFFSSQMLIKRLHYCPPIAATWPDGFLFNTHEADLFFLEEFGKEEENEFSRPSMGYFSRIWSPAGFVPFQGIAVALSEGFPPFQQSHSLNTFPKIIPQLHFVCWRPSILQAPVHCKRFKGFRARALGSNNAQELCIILTFPHATGV